MPQMNKGGKFIFGESVISQDGHVQFPIQAVKEPQTPQQMRRQRPQTLPQMPQLLKPQKLQQVKHRQTLHRQRQEPRLFPQISMIFR